MNNNEDYVLLQSETIIEQRYLSIKKELEEKKNELNRLKQASTKAEINYSNIPHYYEKENASKKLERAKKSLARAKEPKEDLRKQYIEKNSDDIKKIIIIALFFFLCLAVGIISENGFNIMVFLFLLVWASILLAIVFVIFKRNAKSCGLNPYSAKEVKEVEDEYNKCLENYNFICSEISKGYEIENERAQKELCNNKKRYEEFKERFLPVYETKTQEMEELEETFCKSLNISYMGRCNDLIRIFDKGRADNIKDALNVLEADDKADMLIRVQQEQLRLAQEEQERQQEESERRREEIERLRYEQEMQAFRTESNAKRAGERQCIACASRCRCPVSVMSNNRGNCAAYRPNN